MNDYDDDGTHNDARLWWIKAMRSVVFCVVVLAFTAVGVYRLATAQFNFAQLDFSQTLSLILALFSIWLSATFYFKATDTSNKFYDRTFGHTKDLIQALVRIEERFGQMLKDIHEDTSATRQFSQSKGEKRKLIKTAETVEADVATTPEAKGPSSVEEKK